jgi:K+-transporting ATPase ATPase C chain
MWNSLKRAVRLLAVMTVLTGIAYPAAVTAVAWAVFPARANGSMVTGTDGRPAGSALIGQAFSRPEYFHPRPSAAGRGYDAMRSGGSNLGPGSPVLAARVAAAIATFRRENPGDEGPVPADAVTASASGLDPDISPANAAIQAARVARARHVDEPAVRAIVASASDRPWLGFIGEPRVNVLRVNLALDARFGRP